MNNLGPAEIERRLANALRDLLSRASWLSGWTVKRAPRMRNLPNWDLVASGPLPDGQNAILCVECKQHFQPSQFSALADRPCPENSHNRACRVLAMPYVSPRMAALCQQHGWGWFDLAGNCRLEIPGTLLIERVGQDPVRLVQRSAANLSSPEAGRVVRALLAPENAGKRWTQRAMAAHFNALTPAVPCPSLALVNKVAQHLRDQAFLEPLPNRGFQVRDHQGLLEVWRQAYRFDRAQRRRYFTLLQGRALNDALRTLDAIAQGRVAYSSFSAAAIQAPHVRQARTWLYVSPDFEELFVAKVEAKPVDSGENLIVLIPDDDGVFYHLDISKNRLACTNAVQTYIDLSQASGRGEEAAEAVLQQKLKPAWSRGKE